MASMDVQAIKDSEKIKRLKEVDGIQILQRNSLRYRWESLS